MGPAQQLDVVNRAARYFSHHFSEEIELEAVARSIGVSAEWLDLCFDHCRGKTPFQTLQHIRLSRLFEGIAAQPHTTLQQQVHLCGLASVMAVWHPFVACAVGPRLIVNCVSGAAEFWDRS